MVYDDKHYIEYCIKEIIPMVDNVVGVLQLLY